MSTDEIPIQPKNIKLEKLWSTFDHSETEVSAYYVLKLCQERGGWFPFTLEDIEATYQKSGHRGYTFNRLIEPEFVFLIGGGPYAEGGGWIARDENGKHWITDDFVLRCYREHAATPSAKPM